MTFKATIKLVLIYLARKTVPKRPSPNLRMILKLSLLSTLEIDFSDDVLLLFRRNEGRDFYERQLESPFYFISTAFPALRE
jgi:hypothetical protein